MGLACLMDCDAGYFCDPGTWACETCLSICDPLRDTMEYCRSVLACKDYHSTTTSPDIISVPSSSSSSIYDDTGDHRFGILVSMTIFGFCFIMSVIVAAALYLRRRRHRRATDTSNCLCWNANVKTSIPISPVEQEMTAKAPNGGNPFIFHHPNDGADVEMVPLKIHSTIV